MIPAKKSYAANCAFVFVRLHNHILKEQALDLHWRNGDEPTHYRSFNSQNSRHGNNVFCSFLHQAPPVVEI